MNIVKIYIIVCISILNVVSIFFGVKVNIFKRPTLLFQFYLEVTEVNLRECNLCWSDWHFNCSCVHDFFLLKFNVNESGQEVWLKLVDRLAVLTHIDVNLINSSIVGDWADLSLKFWQQLNVVHKVAISFWQLMNYALSIIGWFAILENEIYAEVSIFYKFAILDVQDIRKTKYFLVICLNYTHYLVLVCFKVLIK